METQTDFKRVKNCPWRLNTCLSTAFHIYLCRYASYPRHLDLSQPNLGTRTISIDTNLNYVGPIPDVSYFGVDEMSISERREFMTWYDNQKHKVFNNKLVLEKYCQDDVTVLRQACQIFRREFIEIGNIEVFLESFTIASACNKVLRKRFLKPYTIGLIPAGG